MAETRLHNLHFRFNQAHSVQRFTRSLSFFLLLIKSDCHIEKKREGELLRSTSISLSVRQENVFTVSIGMIRELAVIPRWRERELS